ncbi:UDP-Gal or UDP-GlcNAc-dependent glycosyltransferase, putative [Trypanosoma brucei brucei TREU927]|uniref:Hexosyltransferase n=2 Tax=Trypanosoma brucei brucei (strain 927/4 GUTat10.1) TaxID=185431 RepID=Q584H7_TRYB2|nr:UDP-Gal or UDP-GlcNAc-dependent glycosyltransferase, putative [Trypanosoma brucei brucei TREU927]XP_844677.1 UDP-Gal or UDP-GlcNAc-dependent glycosyltransferase, putative [Trypanosoma brucei brucei TREU927]AAX80570.1 UDP-Gal or UDP-GlcNAc-dependent glycosyltransferase, putative [Trypanosoma brucei]AAX80574.1 UDP-Gal or UDP-GlcNAc-dependent glycosyltransferase, putative [Trypanosoma brucei]AAZ11114.1 UDP-Gal or UDP-GlcNAc-dependent glycosyltransferase, putative [Trypanosoma brucei brucei TREU
MSPLKMRPTQARRRPRTADIAVILLLVMSLLIICCNLHRIHVVSTFLDENQAGVSQPIDEDEYLMFVPSNVAAVWKAQRFLAVLGIPSVDNSERSRRRDLQRQTCWKYSGVATRSNNFSGSLLPLYLLAPHQSNSYLISHSLKEEAARTHDIITLPTNDVSPSTRKKIGENGNWGIEAEVAMSRKTYLWLRFALHMFPNVSYIVKGDDDIFIRVPKYLADLRVMPRHGLYMGRYNYYNRIWRRNQLTYVNGYCITLSRDTAQAIISYKPLERLVNMPFSMWDYFDFLDLGMFYEDVMVGMILREKVVYRNLISVEMGRCHFHNAGKFGVKKSVRNMSVVIHHIQEADYEMLMDYFPEGVIPPAPSKLMWLNSNWAAMQCEFRLGRKREILPSFPFWRKRA